MGLRDQFAHNLRTLMFERKLSQQQLADLAGITQTIVSSWVTKRSWPSAEQLEAVAKALNVRVYDLMKDPGLSDEDKAKIDADEVLRPFKILLEKAGYKITKK